MSNSHTVATGDANWKYAKEDDDYRSKEGCKTVIAEPKSPVAGMLAGSVLRKSPSFAVCTNGAARVMKNCNSFADNEAYNAVDDKIAYQHEIENGDSLDKGGNYVTNEQNPQKANVSYEKNEVSNQCHHSHIDWRESEVANSTSISTELENASYSFDENYDGDDEYTTSFTFDDVDDDYYEGAVGGEDDCGGRDDDDVDVYDDDENYWDDDVTADEAEINVADENDDDDVYPQNNRFASEIGVSSDNEGSFHYEDIYNESDYELDSEGHIISRTDQSRIEYYNGMTIEEMAKLMERANQHKKSTD